MNAAPRSLRTRINALVAGLMLLMLLVLTAVDLANTRLAVHEEISASHRIATQLVREVAAHYGGSDARELAAFLARLGRVRSNEMTLRDAAGRVLYASPPSPYKPGRDAPAWYAWLVTPPPSVVVLPLGDAALTIEANPTRAVLDGWDGMKTQTAGIVLLLLAVNALVFVRVGRWLAPLAQVRAALARIGQGEWSVRMPRPGPSARTAEIEAMAQAVNGMAQALQERQQAVLQAARAEARLSAERGFVRDLHARIEAERRELAATLHDELGQSLTAVRTLSQAVVRHGLGTADADAQRARHAAALLLRSTDEMYAAMHRLIPRLRPPALDRLGLGEALQALVDGLRQQHPQMAWQLSLHGLASADGAPLALPEPLKINAYRIVQEALNNVIKHARASAVEVALRLEAGRLRVRVADDGVGMPQPGPVNGRFGLYGMAERAEALGGHLAFARADGGGLVITADLPADLSADWLANVSSGTSAEPGQGAVASQSAPRP
ncbi:MAG: HAMP domain-containing sensor histidine kinase [Comamonas sp.]